MRVLDCVTHALNCITQPDATRIKPDDIGRDISPEVLGEVSRFLDTHAARAKLTEARR